MGSVDDFIGLCKRAIGEYKAGNLEIVDAAKMIDKYDGPFEGKVHPQ